MRRFDAAGNCVTDGVRQSRLRSMAALAFAMVLQSAAWGATQSAPNIVLILIDDQAWNGTSVQMDPNVPGSRSDFYQTPNLEALASAGMRFSNGYSAAPVCASTRGALVTGKSPAQLQMTDLPHAQPGTARYEDGYISLPLTPPTPEPFDPTQLTLPRLLKQANADYLTAHLGKWHLDTPGDATPESAGYDYSADPRLPNEEIDPWGVQQLSLEANAFMESAVTTGHPFYVQISHHAVHPPIRSRSTLREKYENLPPGTIHDDPAYAAMTEDLDASLATITSKLTELGIDDNTYVFYVSDNGAPLAYSPNTPLKYGKGSIAEGGIRIPFIVKGPGIAAGTVSEIPVVTTDLMTTVAAIGGYTGPTPTGVEGANLLPVLHNGGELQNGTSHLERQFAEGGEIYFHFPHNTGVGRGFRIRPSSAVRDGDYKLLVEYGENGGPDVLSLFDLRSDISETVNLANALPEKRMELKAKLDNYLTAVDASFAFDVKAPIQLAWDAGQLADATGGWRSTIDVGYKGLETWTLGGGTEQPQLAESQSYQPGMPRQVFAFDGDDVMRHAFFQVGDIAIRRNTVNPGTPDFDRSASIDMWFKSAAIEGSQVLFETGGLTSGMSLTLGDADGIGGSNDLRFRVLGAGGKWLTATAPIDVFSNPHTDFIHATAVFSDDNDDRYAAIYINGALAARSQGLAGSTNSLQWDSYDGAGIGNTVGSLGGGLGPGVLPFDGGFVGELAAVDFWNYALDESEIVARYNAHFDPPTLGIRRLSGDVANAWARPANVSLGAHEYSSLVVMQERRIRPTESILVDALAAGGDSYYAGGTMIGGALAADKDMISYLLHFDPVGSDGSSTKSVSGTIDFTQDILGLMLSSNFLSMYDPVLGSIGAYGNSVDRGLVLSGSDYLKISPDRRRLEFNLSVAGDEMLEFRVLTDALGFAEFFASPADLIRWEESFGVDGHADANHDGFSDGTDFLSWQRKVGNIDHEPGNELAIWKAAFNVDAAGDADGDGDSDGSDFLLWQRLQTEVFPGASNATADNAQVPEPAAAMLFVLALAPVAVLRRRLRRSA